MSRQWPQNMPSWQDRDAAPPNGQPVSQPPEDIDPFEPLSKPKYIEPRRVSSSAKTQLPHQSLRSYFAQAPEYSTGYTPDPRQSFGRDPRHDVPQTAARDNEYSTNFHRSPGHHAVHGTPKLSPRDARYLHDHTAGRSYQATTPELAPNRPPATNHHVHRVSQPHTFGQQMTPPSLSSRGTRLNDSYGSDAYQINPPRTVNSSPTARLGGHHKQQAKSPHTESSSLQARSRLGIPYQRSHIQPQTTYTATENVYHDYHDTRVTPWQGSVAEPAPYATPRPSLPTDQTRHSPSRPPYFDTEDAVPDPSTTRRSECGPTTPVVHGIRLVSLRQALPDRFRALFPYELLNAVQSKCFPVVYGGTDNVVVSAPTGSGKTTILELAICKLALDRGNENFKIVYQAPTKALCSEKARDWERKFSHMNLKCAELTGDTSQAEMRRVGDASIIVTTPEKWDSITRKWQDHKRLLQLVELFLIDEVHILKDARGATLEAVVSRMKTIGANVRFIALSATVPNSDDIAQWLGRNHTNQHLPAHRETFGEEFRPVKLQKFVYGYEYSGNEYMFEKFLDQKIPGLISRHSQKKPILIFCFTRKSCETTAMELADYASSRPAGDKLWPISSKRIPVIGRELQEIVKFGVAFHHAGIELQDRMAVEQSFLKGDLGVICCTSTLAVGINLPCHTVFLKGTVGFNDDKVQEYSDLEVMQMLGRAGRPQFDDSAIAVILTRKENKNRYEKMVSGQEILESTLHLNLIEHLNSEICLGTIHNLQSAKTWLSGTFLSVRLRRNPNYYRLTDSTSNPDQIDDNLAEICERDIKELQSADLVTNRDSFRCTDYGTAMSKYLVEFSTMKMLLQIPRGANLESLITIISQSTEFKDFRLKPTERIFFREINQPQLIPYPIKEAVGQTWHKISLMIQAHLGCVQDSGSAEAAKVKRQLMSERKAIFERLNRLVRAVIDCKEHDCDSVGMKNALELVRALCAESWEGHATQLTQIPNIGPVGMRKLSSKGIKTVLELASKEPQDIERYLSRQPPFGTVLLSSLDKFPRLDLDLALIGHKVHKTSEPVMDLEVKATLRYLNRKGPSHWKNRSPGLTFLAESSDGVLAFFWKGNVRKLDPQAGLELKFTVVIRDPSHTIACHLSCEEIVGTNISKALYHNIPESAFPKPSKTTPARTTQKTTAVREYMDDDGIDDTDLLDLAENTETAHSTTAFITEPLQEVEFEDFPSIEDLLEMEEGELEREYTHITSPEPVQLSNGKWKCNHVCSGGILTKTGKACNHRCCKEGIDKPRKRTTKLKRKAEDGREITHGIEEKRSQGQDSHKIQTIVPRSQSKSHQALRIAKRIKTAYTQTPVNVEHQSSAPTGTQRTVDIKAFPDMDVECIDLSFSDDEGKIKGEASSAASKTWKAEIKHSNTAHSTPQHLEVPLKDDDDDCVLLESFGTTNNSSDINRPSILSKHFKAGATDAMLYEGISSKFDEAKEASHSDGIDEIYGQDEFHDDGTTMCVGSSPMFLERAEGLSGPVSTQDSTRSNLQVAEEKETKSVGFKREEDPKWLSEMQLDAESMEIVDSLRGFVTFV